MTIFGALTLLAHHGNAGEHFAAARDILVHWGGGNAAVSQSSGASLWGLSSVLAPIGLVLMVLGLLGILGAMVALGRGIGLVLVGALAALIALVA
jgi:hypothetical protein